MFRLLSIKLSLGFLASVLYVPTFLIAAFLPRRNRAYLWRWVAIELIETALFLGGVRIKIIHPYTNTERNLIYASNHPSPLDGFLLQAVLGPNAVPIIAPFAQFPFMIALWLRRMGAIDVLRDDVDKARYRGSNTKKEALEKALAALRRGESLIIFPEGHTEMIEALYYFHTGTARLSLASGVAIQPLVIHNAHRVFTNNLTRSRRLVSVAFERKLIPRREYGEEILFTEDVRLREEVRDMTARLEGSIMRALPLRARHEQRTRSSDTAVFVDIDMTVYDGLSQLDFVVHLIRSGHVSLKEGGAVFWLFVREHLGLLSHERMMQGAMQILAGWDKGAVDRLIARFFRHVALPKLQYGMFSLLEDHLAKGHRLIFVSEAMHPLAQRFADFFEADGAIDTSLRRRGRVYTGEIRMLCRGENKAQGIREYAQLHSVDLSKSYAYADSFTDVQMLSLVGHPVAVRPDRRLRRFASSHGVRVLKHVS